MPDLIRPPVDVHLIDRRIVKPAGREGINYLPVLRILLENIVLGQLKGEVNNISRVVFAIQVDTRIVSSLITHILDALNCITFALKVFGVLIADSYLNPGQRPLRTVIQDFPFQIIANAGGAILIDRQANVIALNFIQGIGLVGIDPASALLSSRKRSACFPDGDPLLFI